MNKMLYPIAQVQPHKKQYPLTARLTGFLIIVPPVFLILTPINAASAAVLSLSGFPPWHKAIIGLVAVAMAGWGVNAFNHYTDRDRDRIIWPQRAIPTGKVNASAILSAAILSLICALLLAWFAFNQMTFIILLVAIILGLAYSVTLRDKIGYLSLPPIVGLIYLGGWAAFSAETLFSSILPWYLFLLGLVWQAAHISVYYPLHIIYDTEDSIAPKTTPLFFIKASPKRAAIIGLCLTSLTILMSILLPLFASLSYFYLILVIAAGAYALTKCLLLLNGQMSREKEMNAFVSLSLLRLSISVAILFEVSIRYLQ